jgi:hypothetical protein
MRRAAAVDKNQQRIVMALRYAGACVIITSQLKKAFDILVIYNGDTFIVEIKDGDLSPSKRRLTTGEQLCKESIERAGGMYHIIESVDDALNLIGIE